MAVSYGWGLGSIILFYFLVKRGNEKRSGGNSGEMNVTANRRWRGPMNGLGIKAER